jgi:hypothetical protein
VADDSICYKRRRGGAEDCKEYKEELGEQGEFVAADGTRFDGLVSPHEEPHAGYTQPTIVTDHGQVNFWFGLFPPKPDAIKGAYRTLAKTAPRPSRRSSPSTVAEVERLVDGRLGRDGDPEVVGVEVVYCDSSDVRGDVAGGKPKRG